MSHEGKLILAGYVKKMPDPPAVRALGNAAPQDPAQMDGQQIIQWFTAQAGDMAGNENSDFVAIT